MRYKSFIIKNFKGIKEARVNLETLTGANIFAFVGLNESGKTTLLEAIHSFAPDAATSELLGGMEGSGVPINERVPRHLLSEFTGFVSVTAELSATERDKKRAASLIREKLRIEVDLASFPDTICLERSSKFERGDFKGNFFTLRTALNVKSKSGKKWRAPTGQEIVPIRDLLFSLAPRIAYFPTFVFDFPSSIFLTDRGSKVDRFYRRVFQDILDYDGRGQNIEDDIVSRVRKEELTLPWAVFWSKWREYGDNEKIQQVMDRASSAVTRLIFGRWNKIFGEDTRGKEILISHNIIEGEVSDAKGNKSNTQSHDVSIKFQIKDGTRRYDVNDRSLGFRWFFCFMLFTQFRVARNEANDRTIVFLFDEPAANLHAAAQERLIESFPEITRKGHLLLYSTHSHYMIEPKWLEQTFIVTNRSDAVPTSVLDEISLNDESLDIKVAPYRSFVDSNPSKTSYFQPVLDRLQVVPSRLDLRADSLVVEGRSDYYILRYACTLLNESELKIIPGLGATTFGSLAALNVGWNLNFVFLLDSDSGGETAASKYSIEFGIDRSRLLQIGNIVPGAECIEDILDSEALKVISGLIGIGTIPTKAQIKRFFQESLAKGQKDELGTAFRKNALRIISKVKETLKARGV